MYDVLVIAKYVIFYCNQKKYVIHNFKLQQILYFIQAEFLVGKGIPCFNDRIEAWNIGVVIPKVYNIYKIFGCCDLFITKYDIDNINTADRKIIEAVIDECDKYSYSQFVKIIHNQTPWKRAYINTEKIITHQSIKNFFDN